MKCARLYGQNDLRLEEIPVPEISDEEILVKVKSAAICGTDVRMYKNGAKGIDADHPLIIGHEMAGVIEKTGKNVDEALDQALNELKTTRDKVNIEVIEEAKNGLFGLFSKKAKIRVTLKDAAAKIGDVVEEALDNIKADVQAGKEEYKNTAVDTDTEAAVKKEFVVDEEAVQAGKEFLQKIFHSMKIEVVMEKFVNKADSTVTLKLHGPDMGILIGKHGQTLDALQYLTNLVANKNSSERIRIIIDVEDYRERRIETLSRLAVRLADKVKRNGERVVLEPMNPHERKIIHMALQNDRRITTLSEGEEPYRKVVIELKK